MNMPFTVETNPQSMSAEVSTATAIRRIQNAALERALLQGDHDGRYVRFAGTLEELRQNAARCEAEGLFAPLFACTALAGGGELSPELVDPWTPSVSDDDTRLEGAILAYRRFDIELGRGARLAGRSTADFEAVLRNRDSE